VEKEPQILKRLNVPCGIRIDDRQLRDAVYALEAYYDGHTPKDADDLNDALSNLNLNYIKFIDVFIMSDGTMRVAPDQHSSESLWSPHGPLSKDILEEE
jgi:hypothetical protein